MSDNKTDMCRGPLLKKIIFYTMPIIATGVLQLLFNAADLVVVGRFCGKESMAAVGSTSYLINLITNLFIGLSVGAGVAVAHGLGSQDDDEVQKTVHTTMPVALISGVILTVVGIIFSRTFLEMMNSPENIIDLSALYLKIYFAGIIPILIYNYGAAILRAAGDTRSPLIYLTSAGVLNVVLNVFFVTVVKLNVAGIALATTISQLMAAVLVVIKLIRRDDACAFDPRRMRIHKNQLMKILKIGVPAGIQGSLFSISNVIIQSSVNTFGDVAVAGNAASHNIEGFIYTAMLAFSQAALNFTGQNFGSRKYKRVRKIAGISIGCVVVVGLALSLTILFFGRTLLGIYIDDSPEAIAVGLSRLRIMLPLYFVCGVMETTTGCIRGIGCSFTPMVTTIIGACVLRVVWVFTVYQIPQFHTLSSLYISYPVSWVITAAVQIIIFLVVWRRQARRLVKPPAHPGKRVCKPA